MSKMKVVVQIPQRIDRIKEAINKGGYEGPSEFINIAIQNQVELELDSESNDNLTTIDQALSQDTDTSDTKSPNLTKSSSADFEHDLAIPQSEAVATISPPDVARLDSGPLWGQYNRILPVKLTVRILANKLKENSIAIDNGQKLEGMISLGNFSEQVSDIAREFGLKIQAKDEEYSRSQGEKLSAALPIGDDPEKSKERFKTHFVGRAEQGGDLTGAAPHLLFVNMPADDPGKIGLTKAGLKFALMSNPLIDGDLDSNRSLSDEEVRFYINHVAEKRSAEFKAMQSVATAVQNGKNRPDSLTEHVASINENWTYAQARTVRSGLVSRMFELGIIRRERVGQRGIQYELTTGSEEVLNLHE